MYGNLVVTDYQRNRGRTPDVIGRVETSPSGNLILNVGKLIDFEPFSGWEKSGHIVLNPAEARRFVEEIQEAMA